MKRFRVYHPLGDGRTLALFTWCLDLGRFSHVGQAWRWRWKFRFHHTPPTRAQGGDIDSHIWDTYFGPITLLFTWRPSC